MLCQTISGIQGLLPPMENKLGLGLVLGPDRGLGQGPGPDQCLEGVEG